MNIGSFDHPDRRRSDRRGLSPSSRLIRNLAEDAVQLGLGIVLVALVDLTIQMYGGVGKEYPVVRDCRKGASEAPSSVLRRTRPGESRDH